MRPCIYIYTELIICMLQGFIIYEYVSTTLINYNKLEKRIERLFYSNLYNIDIKEK